MNRLLCYLMIFLFFGELGGCRAVSGDPPNSGEVILGDTAGTAAINGTVTYLPLEGGWERGQTEKKDLNCLIFNT